ncbi:hypothetical protein [Roseiconus lacunae]|uniref:Uncharacterized protein n=1 Tax=Roseiconus lacunae TaxID=2605694 RepID=A0ABT7PJ71_9BACT|nr:hypothetical protein [Roseiconus lacunae]MCD0462909.1 hypothetical protein [Roseiconus lacunae]MDM4016525.1 hypothetical protein [Roseiconus lacunae]WRQ49396.1 hypothetical protein U8335_20855 [Stieleria sp. HD01]
MVQQILDFDQLPNGQLFRFNKALYRKMGESMAVLILRAMREKPTDNHIVHFDLEQAVEVIPDPVVPK